MGHGVKKNVSETGFENGGWLEPTKDHARGKKHESFIRLFKLMHIRVNIFIVLHIFSNNIMEYILQRKTQKL
jgi:hypothetical protein